MCYRCSKGWGGRSRCGLVCFTAGAFADDAMAMGIDTLVLDSGVRSSIRTLTGMIQNEHFDIVHCHGSRANMIGAILKRTIKVPIVTTVHSDYRLDYLGRPFHRLTYGHDQHRRASYVRLSHRRIGRNGAAAHLARL